ncbi:MAG TPA: PEP-CTERM sorting domain-containing protein [Candidatus Sulfotelmatobacter sp.]|nr:PEP-CTERM sorting domain-containing protein [Candidatus Sulfotelmatobacter sp.]
MKNHQATLLFAVILVAPAFASADNISAHSRSGNSLVSFSEGLADQQDLKGNSARCNFLVSSIKEEGSKSSSFAPASFSEFAKGEKGANLGAYLSTGMDSDVRPPRLVDFGGNQGASSETNNGKGKGKPKGAGGDGDGNGNGTGVGSGAPEPLMPVPEPASQTLVLFGMAGLGLFLYRRKLLLNAI